MIPQRSALSLLVYLTCLGFMSSPARAFFQGGISLSLGLGQVSANNFINPTFQPSNYLAQFFLGPSAQFTQPASPASPAVTPDPPIGPESDNSRIWFFGLMGLAAGSVLGGSIFYLTRRGHGTEAANPQANIHSVPKVLRPSPAKGFQSEPLTVTSQALPLENQRNGHHNLTSGSTSVAVTEGEDPKPARVNPSLKDFGEDSFDQTADHLSVGETSLLSKHVSDSISSQQDLAIGETTRLSKVSIADELIKDLQSLDRGKRSKAIWELGQRGDSQAVQPLVDLMIDSDSKQRSLVLAALSEIGVRTLKPLNRALAISLQDDNPEVRKNAIRDLTRIYDQVTQISQLLRHATEDSDTEVQETARWALNQVGRIRTAAGIDPPALQNSPNPQEHLPGS